MSALAPSRAAPLRITTEANPFAAAALSVIEQQVEHHARRFYRAPILFNAISPGLALLPARELVHALDRRIEAERAKPRRWMGFGGEVELVNLRAARRAAEMLVQDEGMAS